MRFCKTIWVVVLLLVTGIAWVAADNAYFRPRPVKFTVPAGWPQPVYDFKSNPLTQEGIALGLSLIHI